MPQPTSIPAQIVADTIVRTVELGVRITDAAVDGEITVLWCELLTDGPGACRRPHSRGDRGRARRA